MRRRLAIGLITTSFALAACSSSSPVENTSSQGGAPANASLPGTPATQITDWTDISPNECCDIQIAIFRVISSCYAVFYDQSRSDSASSSPIPCPSQDQLNR